MKEAGGPLLANRLVPLWGDRHHCNALVPAVVLRCE